MYRPVHNTSDRPVVTDDDGHTLGGQEWGAVDTDQPRLAPLIDNGTLVIVGQIGDDANDEAKAAHQDAERLNSGGKPKAKAKPSTDEEPG